MFRRLRHWWRVWWRVKSVLDLSDGVFLVDLEDRDYRDLALGRWHAFKAFNALEFTIGMSSDGEALLDQYTFFTLGGGKALSGVKRVEQVQLKISICMECINTGKTLNKKLVELGVLSEVK
jgi:hypothetical protein